MDQPTQTESLDNTQKNLGYIIIVGFFLTLIFTALGFFTPTVKDILNIMIGSLGTMSANVVNYYFGSSMSSKLKDIARSNNER